MELLLRLDRTDVIVAQSVASQPGKTAYFSEEQEQSSVTGTVSGSALYPSPVAAFLQAPAEPEVEAMGVDETESDDEFDMTCFDDDGTPLVDTEGQTLIPMEPEKTYEEEESIFLCAFAGTYREVRGQLQATGWS